MNKWMSKLQKLDGAVLRSPDLDPHANPIRSFSPSVNFCFGNNHGLPLGLSIVMAGYPKSGKSVVSYSMVGQLHQSDPEAIAVIFDTELRTHVQLDAQAMAAYGIDPERLLIIQTNIPSEVFDQIEQKIGAMCQEGAPIKLVIVDSITGVRGRRSLNADGIDTVQIGDDAKTIQDGLKIILPVQRRCGFAVILTCQVRAEMDPLEQKRGNKVKMSVSYGVQHYAEYFMFVEANRNKDGRSDLLGNELKDAGDGQADVLGNEDQVAHKIRVKMKDSSCGPKGRNGEFTLSYSHGKIVGIKNTHEEVFLLAKNSGVLTQPNAVSYEFGGQKWVGKPAMLEALKTDPNLYQTVLDEVYRRDRAGEIVETSTVETE